MKKVKILLLLFMMSALMVACGGETSNESNINAENSNNEYSTESSMAGELEQTEETEIALWEKYPIMPGMTWEYKIDENTTVFANVSYNEDGSATVQGFAYNGNELAEEYLLEKTLYTEDGCFYSTEDGMLDMISMYEGELEFVDYENGLFEGAFSLVADENTDDLDEVRQIVTEDEIKDFFRDTNNIGQTIGIVLVYSGDFYGYHTFNAANVYGLFQVDTSTQSTILFNGDLVYVEGVYKGFSDLGNPYLELSYFTLMDE